MVKNVMFVKVFYVFLVSFVLSPTVTAQSSQSVQAVRNTIQGSWEIQTNSGLQVIYFSAGGIFVSYLDGNFDGDGSYSIGEPVPNQPQTLKFEFGIFDRMDSEFYIVIRANELVFTTKSPNKYGSSIAIPGTYKRSSFVNSERSNPLVGTWKGASEIYRFYRNAPGGTIFGGNKAGTYFVFQNEPEYSEGWRFRLTYNFSARPGAGEISFYGFNEDWSYGVFLVVPFTINGNVLRVEYENGTREYIRQ